MVTTAKSPHHHTVSAAPAQLQQSVDANSPKFPRKNFPSPWAQVVRGGEPESTSVIHQSPPSTSSSSSSLITDQALSSDCSPKVISLSPPMDNSNTVGVADSSDVAEDNADRSKKPVWNKPSNGVVETGPVMGAESWPSLSASTKGSAKLPAESSSKTVADGSLSTSQVWFKYIL
ncbi:hypothetical protein V8G54_037903 (chloroplast) [Vigna mungo]|uniref:Uncharacterized protein n=1 Tax=Vigna mungo TaxID=3915 RepID=A0AAQ3R8Z8_VIGMU